MSERYGVTSLDELAAPTIPGQARWHTIRRTLGVASVGVNAWTATVVGAKPGEVFAPSTWERAAEALRYWPTEEWDAAIAVLEGHLADTPDHAGTHYNRACAHARAGRPDVALGYARRAIELQESFADYAPKDEDLATVRDQL